MLAFQHAQMLRSRAGGAPNRGATVASAPRLGVRPRPPPRARTARCRTHSAGAVFYRRALSAPLSLRPRQEPHCAEESMIVPLAALLLQTLAPSATSGPETKVVRVWLDASLLTRGTPVRADAQLGVDRNLFALHRTTPCRI